MPQILVLTPTLGNRATIARTISSVERYGGDNVRHVLIAPQNVIDSLSSIYPKTECIAEPIGNHGIYGALNYGFHQLIAQHPFITFINDDDEWLPGMQKLISAILTNQYDIVYGKTNYVDNTGRFISEQTCSSQFNSFVPLLKKGIVIFTQQATVIKSKWFDKLGGFDTNYKLVADTKFWCRLSLANPIYKYFNVSCANYMVQEGQLSSNKDLQFTETIKLLSEFPNIKKASFITVLWFRLQNIHVYASRFLHHRSFHNPM